MNKIFAIMTAATLFFTSMPVTALFHGHSGSANRTGYTLCAVEDCNTTGYHNHNNTTYSGHYYGDGHNEHQVCDISDCSLTQEHTHDTITCLPHNNGDGHGYHNSKNRKHH